MKKVWCKALRAMYFSGRGTVPRGTKFSIPKMEAERLLQETSNFRGAFEVIGPVVDKVFPKPTARDAKPTAKTSAKPRKRSRKTKKK